MDLFVPPSSFLTLVEACGGFYRTSGPRNPTMGLGPFKVRGFVLVANFCPARAEVEPKHGGISEVLFPDEKAAKACANSLRQFKTDLDGWLISVEGIYSIKDYYYCGFCGRGFWEVNKLFHGNEGRSICGHCVANFAASLDRGASHDD